MTKNFFHPSLLLLFLDPGSGMCKNQDPGSGINIPDPPHCFLDDDILLWCLFKLFSPWSRVSTLSIIGNIYAV